MPLKRQPNLKDPDGLYAAILAAHADLSESESVALNARLVLLLANRVVAAGPPAEVLADGPLRAAYGGRVLRVPEGVIVMDDPHHDHQDPHAAHHGSHHALPDDREPPA